MKIRFSILRYAFLMLCLFSANSFAAGLPTVPINLGTYNQVPEQVTPESLHGFLKSYNRSFDPDSGQWADIARIYQYWGEYYGIRWDYAFFQMLHETGFLRYRGGVSSDDYNFAGIGAVVTGEAGDVANSTQDGVLTHIQHLAIYGLKPIPDSEFVSNYSRRVRNWIQGNVLAQLGGPATFNDLSDDGGADKVVWAEHKPDYFAMIQDIANRYGAYLRRSQADVVPPVAGPPARPPGCAPRTSLREQTEQRQRGYQTESEMACDAWRNWMSENRPEEMQRLLMGR